mgnify:CR=1 FL=1
MQVEYIVFTLNTRARRATARWLRCAALRVSAVRCAPEHADRTCGPLRTAFGADPVQACWSRPEQRCGPHHQADRIRCGPTQSRAGSKPWWSVPPPAILKLSYSTVGGLGLISESLCINSKAKRRIRGTRPEGTGLVPRGGLVPSGDFGSERFLKTKRRILGTTSLVGTRSDCRSLTIPAQSRSLERFQERFLRSGAEWNRAKCTSVLTEGTSKKNRYRFQDEYAVWFFEALEPG